MDIQTRKIKFVREFLEMHNEALLTLMEQLLHAAQKDREKELHPMTMDVLNERIDKSLEDSQNGKLTKSIDLISEIQGWK